MNSLAKFEEIPLRGTEISCLWEWDKQADGQLNNNSTVSDWKRKKNPFCIQELRGDSVLAETQVTVAWIVSNLLSTHLQHALHFYWIVKQALKPRNSPLTNSSTVCSPGCSFFLIHARVLFLKQLTKVFDKQRLMKIRSTEHTWTNSAFETSRDYPVALFT